MRTHGEDSSPPVESRASARLPELCSAHLSPLKRSKGTYAFAPEANPLSSSAGGDSFVWTHHLYAWHSPVPAAGMEELRPCS